MVSRSDALAVDGVDGGGEKLVSRPFVTLPVEEPAPPRVRVVVAERETHEKLHARIFGREVESVRRAVGLEVR